MKTELQDAKAALRSALHAAIDSTTINENQLTELWRHYLGVSAIEKSCPQDPDPFGSDPFSTDNYGNYSIAADDYDGWGPDQPIAAGSVNIPGGLGQDVITFNS